MALERPHLWLSAVGPRLDYQLRGSGGEKDRPPRVGNRQANARRVISEVRALIREAEEIDAPELDPDRIPMTVRSTTDWGVAKSLPGRKNDILSSIGFGRNARLNVALDPDTIKNFDNAAERYTRWIEGRKRPHHFEFFEAQPEVQLTDVEDLWMSHLPIPEEGVEARWEVWLQPSAEPRFREVLEMLNLRAENSLKLEDLSVLALEASREQFDRLARSASISQLRPASNLNSRLLRVPSGVQQATVAAAAARIVEANEDAPAVCLLDTGIRSDHPLLAGSISTIGSVVGGQGEDCEDHGTNMAGLALFQDLAEVLTTGGNIHLPIRLESVAIEGPGSGASKLPAERLRRAVDFVEGAQTRSRTFCFAMNAPEESADGGASSLSSEIDKLAAEIGGQRLFCVAAGNIEDAPHHGDYQSLNELSPMLAPSQAWNALSIAACTDLVHVPGTHEPVAPAGDLCPWSRTAVNWEKRLRPPAKPDVVFEGGNQMMDLVSQAIGPHPDLCLLTTANDSNTPLALTGLTSAATAAIAGLCARLQAEYPDLWPETVRGLIIHSAEHTDAMMERAEEAAQAGGSRAQALLDRFGYGRPNPARATENAEDALTFINQASLRPLRINDAGNAAILGQMRVHRLPWPQSVLEDLGPEVEAELRVTLSYFIEPNLGAVARGETDQYASHGFDFDIVRPDESEDQAIARNNELQDVRIRSSAPPPAWAFGRNRGRGSIRHDRLCLPAADLARVGGVLVIPRKGWWGRDLERVEQQARYSLIVSIHTPGVEIYNEIANSIAINI